jgi:septal ring factor EnvC (AmiA/AmiB activator)
MGTAFADEPKKSELSFLNKQIQALRQILQRDQQQQANLQSQLETTEMNINTISQQVNKLNASLLQEQTQLKQLIAARRDTQIKLNTQKKALDEQIRAAYQLGNLKTYQIILNHQDPNTLSRHLVYYQHITRARLSLVNEMNRNLKLMADNMRAIQIHQQNLKNLLAQKQQQHRAESLTQDHRKNLIYTLNENLKSKQDRMNVLLANQKSLQDLIKKLQTQAKLPNPAQPFSSLQAKLSWPVKGTLAARFGSPLDVPDQYMTGVVISAAEDTPVRAVSSGKVIFSNWLRGFGLLVIIDHGNQYMSLYGRNHMLYAKVGDRVNTGDVIATTGSSGGFDKTGLYFEIRQNGIPKDPSNWCRV